MGRVIHFEITADDVKRATKFYEIFDWDIKDSGMPGAEYMLATTGTTPYGIDGAIMPKTYKDQPAVIWISVDDIDEMVEKVKKAAGKLVGEKQKVPGVGDSIYISDTENNIVGLLQPLPKDAADRNEFMKV